MISGVKLIDAMLKLLRCTSFAGSASISSTQARRASGMYIMSMYTSDGTGQVKRPFLIAS